MSCAGSSTYTSCARGPQTRPRSDRTAGGDGRKGPKAGPATPKIHSPTRRGRLSRRTDAGGSADTDGECPTNRVGSSDLRRGGGWWSRGESNPLPPECHSGALPDELRPHGERGGILRRGHSVNTRAGFGPARREARSCAPGPPGLPSRRSFPPSEARVQDRRRSATVGRGVQIPRGPAAVTGDDPRNDATALRDFDRAWEGAGRGRSGSQKTGPVGRHSRSLRCWVTRCAARLRRVLRPCPAARLGAVGGRRRGEPNRYTAPSPASRSSSRPAALARCVRVGAPRPARAEPFFAPVPPGSRGHGRPRPSRCRRPSPRGGRCSTSDAYVHDRVVLYGSFPSDVVRRGRDDLHHGCRPRRPRGRDDPRARRVRSVSRRLRAVQARDRSRAVTSSTATDRRRTRTTRSDSATS